MSKNRQHIKVADLADFLFLETEKGRPDRGDNHDNKQSLLQIADHFRPGLKEDAFVAPSTPKTGFNPFLVLGLMLINLIFGMQIALFNDLQQDIRFSKLMKISKFFMFFQLTND